MCIMRVCMSVGEDRVGRLLSQSLLLQRAARLSRNPHGFELLVNPVRASFEDDWLLTLTLTFTATPVQVQSGGRLWRYWAMYMSAWYLKRRWQTSKIVCVRVCCMCVCVWCLTEADSSTPCPWGGGGFVDDDCWHVNTAAKNKHIGSLLQKHRTCICTGRAWS